MKTFILNVYAPDKRRWLHNGSVIRANLIKQTVAALSTNIRASIMV